MANEYRISQQAIEAVVSPDPAARISQQAVEVVVSPDPAARISQVVIEVVIKERLSFPTFEAQVIF